MLYETFCFPECLDYKIIWFYWIGHRKEIRKPKFRALALRRSESRNCGLCVVYTQKDGTTLLVGAWWCEKQQNKFVKWKVLIPWGLRVPIWKRTFRSRVLRLSVLPWFRERPQTAIYIKLWVNQFTLNTDRIGDFIRRKNFVFPSLFFYRFRLQIFFNICLVTSVDFCVFFVSRAANNICFYSISQLLEKWSKCKTLCVLECHVMSICRLYCTCSDVVWGYAHLPAIAVNFIIIHSKTLIQGLTVFLTFDELRELSAFKQTGHMWKVLLTIIHWSAGE